MLTLAQMAEAGRALVPPMFDQLPGDIAVSFEFFPPKSPAMEATLWQSVAKLAPLAPRFVSVTYGAGGSTRERTHGLVERIARETPLAPAAHLTCVGASREEVDEVARAYWEAGVRHIVALRGDPPTPGEAFAPHAEGYAGSAELVAGLRRVADFEISVGAYPEPHPDARSEAADVEHLKRKLGEGATRAITQFFFEPDTFFRFRDRCAAAGIDAEITPGILPVVNFAQARKFAQSCNASVPDWMERLFEGLDDLPDARQLVAAAVAGELCRKLYAGGVRGFHFYTLNRAELAYALCHLMGKRPAGAFSPALEQAA